MPPPSKFFNFLNRQCLAIYTRCLNMIDVALCRQAGRCALHIPNALKAMLTHMFWIYISTLQSLWPSPQDMQQCKTLWRLAVQFCVSQCWYCKIQRQCVTQKNKKRYSCLEQILFLNIRTRKSYWCMKSDSNGRGTNVISQNFSLQVSCFELGLNPLVEVMFVLLCRLWLEMAK